MLGCGGARRQAPSLPVPASCRAGVEGPLHATKLSMRGWCDYCLATAADMVATLVGLFRQSTAQPDRAGGKGGRGRAEGEGKHGAVPRLLAGARAFSGTAGQQLGTGAIAAASGTASQATLQRRRPLVFSTAAARQKQTPPLLPPNTKRPSEPGFEAPTDLRA